MIYKTTRDADKDATVTTVDVTEQESLRFVSMTMKCRNWQNKRY